MSRWDELLKKDPRTLTPFEEEELRYFNRYGE